MSASDFTGPRLDRRTTLAWAAALATGLGATDLDACTPGHKPGPKGYGLDPDMNKGATPWPRIMTANQLRVVVALADFILPADGAAPSASGVHVHELIDEWVSAPYPDQLADRELIFNGIAWINREARRAGASFAQMSAATREAIFARLGSGAPSLEPLAKDFYKRFRLLTIGAYYTTEAGFKDIGYIGNQALTQFPPPSDAVKAALEQAYKTQGLPKRTTPWT